MTDDGTVMLTTIDNPYNPFVQFNEWNAFDTGMGYNTCAYLARVTISSDSLSEIDQALDISKAMDEIVELNINGRYVKVTKENFKTKVKAGGG